MKVCWVKIWIASMATLTERFRDDEGRVDFEALGREEYAFRHALITGDYYKSERARDLAEAAEKDYKIHSENGKKGGRPRKSTADASTREDEEFKSDSGDAGNLESATSANNSGEGSSENVRERTSAKELPSPIVKTDPKPVKTDKVEVKPPSAKHPHGEFENVMLTTEEYIKACASIQDCDSMIERMSSYKASSGKKYKSDYAALLNWSRRDDDRHSLPQAPMYKTAADRDREEIQKIADYYAAQERGEKPPMPKIQLVEGL